MAIRDARGRFVAKGAVRDDFDTFDLQVMGFGTLIGAEAVAFKKTVAFQILSGVIKMTPVDTGRAQNNWQVAIGDAPAPGELEATLDENVAIQRGLHELARVGLGDSIWINNNLAYIGVLERGGAKGSIQAPYGMLMVTLANVEAQFT